jgi:nitrite reductase (cytochrome c-552)
MIERANEIQHTHHEMLDTVMQALVELINQIEDKKAQLDPKTLDQVQKMHSQAQFLIDFVEAENSTGFHAPQESGRVLLKALNIIRKASAEVVND